MAAGEVATGEEVEVVFLSPPWGGLDYLKLGALPAAVGSEKGEQDGARRESKPPYPLKALAPLPGDALFALSRAVTPHVAYYLPRNVDVAEVAGLPARFPRTDRCAWDAQKERMEVEEEWMGSKLKAVTVYYGDLAKGVEV